jgi:thiaminase
MSPAECEPALEKQAGALEIEEQTKIMSARTVLCCNEALDRGQFFQLLRARAIAAPLMQYVFLQYGFWRDQFHKWFALCILKSGSCDEPDQKNAVMALAHHIFTDLRDNHEVMFASFLHDLGLSEHDIATSRPSPATLSYARSFFEDFGYGTDNFHEAIAALSGRELCVSVRNGRILRDFIRPRNLPLSAWLVLHETLEEEHYRDAIRPVLMRHGKDLDKVEAMLKCVSRGIERHVLYFDEMLLEYRGTSVSAP